MLHLTLSQLEAGLDAIRQSPKDSGTLRLIVRRPGSNQRETLEIGRLEPADGLVGDRWRPRNGKSPDQPPDRIDQLTIMGARAAALIAQDMDRWPLAGDQLYIDLDLSYDNVPPGTRLALGTAMIEVTPEPHTGCRKFLERFGPDALKFVNTPPGRQLNLRGIYAQVIQAGEIRPGDTARKLSPPERG
ncbi:MAG: hypothetical protein WDZ59_15045 [Pirellulales bacterium]